MRLKVEILNDGGEEGRHNGPTAVPATAGAASLPPFFIFRLFSLSRSDPRSSPEPKRAVPPGGGDARAGPGGGP